MKRLLVTGASGFLGWQVCRLAAPVYRVIGLCRKGPFSLPGVVSLAFDLTRIEELPALFSDTRPDAVIHTAAASDPNFCQEHPFETRPINVDVPARLALLCMAEKLPFVFTSSDLVFDGHRGPYREEDPQDPVNSYGCQKAEAEREVLKNHPGALVCRLPLLFGWSGSVYHAFDRQIVRALCNKGPLKLFTDEWRTPVDAESAAHGLLNMIGSAWGLLNLGGRERISRFELGLRIASIMGLSEPSIIAQRQAEHKMAAPRASDVSLVSDKAFALGYDPLPVDSAIERLLRYLDGKETNCPGA